MEKIIKWTPAFHKIHEDPKKNYGVGAMQCTFVLKGEKGAVQFMFLTGMFLPKTYDYWESKGLNRENRPPYTGYDVGYHSPAPKYEEQEERDCDLLEGKKCYYDGSALRADKWMKVFVAEGDEKIWSMLQEEYDELFK